MQFYASLVKRVHYTKRTPLALIVQNMLPLLVILISLLVTRTLLTMHDPPALELSPHLFFAKDEYNYLFVGGTYNNITAPMVDSVFKPCGVSAHTLGSDMNSTSICYEDTTRPPLQCPSHDYPQVQYHCNCDSCINANSSEGISGRGLFLSSGVPACYNGTGTGSRVLNLTLGEGKGMAKELNSYLMRTTSTFIQQRYGGISFGHKREDVEKKVDEMNIDSSLNLPFLATRESAKAWYSLKGYHAMPAYLNTLNNAILRGNLYKMSTHHRSEYGKTKLVIYLIRMLN